MAGVVGRGGGKMETTVLEQQQKVKEKKSVPSDPGAQTTEPSPDSPDGGGARGMFTSHSGASRWSAYS